MDINGSPKCLLLAVGIIMGLIIAIGGGSLFYAFHPNPELFPLMFTLTKPSDRFNGLSFNFTANLIKGNVDSFSCTTTSNGSSHQCPQFVTTWTSTMLRRRLAQAKGNNTFTYLNWAQIWKSNIMNFETIVTPTNATLYEMVWKYETNYPKQFRLANCTIKNTANYDGCERQKLEREEDLNNFLSFHNVVLGINHPTVNGFQKMNNGSVTLDEMVTGVSHSLDKLESNVLSFDVNLKKLCRCTLPWTERSPEPMMLDMCLKMENIEEGILPILKNWGCFRTDIDILTKKN